MTEEYNSPEVYDNASSLDDNAVAIIGASGRFPSASSIEAYWKMLASGQTGISHFSKAELREKGVADDVLNLPNYVRAGSVIPDIERFDAAFFDMTPREAEITDPQHRILLECAYDALDNAGYAIDDYEGSIAVYAGVGMNTYLLSNIMANPNVLQSMGMHQLLLGNDKCYACTRIGYKLNLHGPAINLDTACSTSLVAIITGYKALLGYECDIVLAGAAKVNSADVGYMYEPGSINSPDGFCRTFDEEAAGTIFGSGAGMLALKRLEDAQDENDQILGIIRGGAINNDGSDKVGFTAPSVTYQAEVIRDAYAFADIDPTTVSYVEAHGTGTKLGDPVELSALSEVFAECAPESVLIGSVKPNIGHLETAAGVAGVIKVLQAFKHEQIPPSINFKQPNSAINFGENPFKVVTELTAWPRHPEQPRRASISSFGLGGTNAHIILEEPPIIERDAADDNRLELLLLSAKTETALQGTISKLATQFASSAAKNRIDAQTLQDMAFTSTYARREYPVRSAIAVTANDIKNDQYASALHQVGAHEAKPCERVAFVMPGQGSQYPGMSADLVARFPTFKQALTEACNALHVHQPDVDLWALLTTTTATELDTEAITNTAVAQTAIFAHGYAMAQLVADYGIEADVYYGHSLGEYLAVCLAGALSLQDTCMLVSQRAQLMAKAPTGAMLAIALTDSIDVQPMVDALGLDIAAYNSPKHLVASGEHHKITQLAEQLLSKGIENQQLKTSHAFHCRLMESIQAEFAATVSKVRFAQPQKPIISSITGELLSDSQLCQADYWVSQLTQSVHFGKGCHVLAAQADIALDLGPSSTMTGLINSNVADQLPVVSLSPNARQHQQADQRFMAGLGKLWSFGVEVDFSVLYADRECYRTDLPSYSYDKVRCWIDPPVANASVDAAPVAPANTTVQATSAAASDDDASLSAQLCRLWEELLGRATITEHQNFFELGGESLLATRMLARVFDDTGIEIALSAFFDSPTAAGLADLIVTEQLLEDDDEDLDALLAELED